MIPRNKCMHFIVLVVLYDIALYARTRLQATPGRRDMLLLASTFDTNTSGRKPCWCAKTVVVARECKK